MPAKSTPNQAAAAEAKKAIEEIKAVENEDSGIPQGEEISIEDKISGQLVQVLSAPRKSYTGSNQMDDWCYIPETIKVRDGSVRRISKHVRVMGQIRYLTADAEYLLRWCHPGRFNRHQRQGFTFVLYNDLLEDTDAWAKSPEGYIKNGDLYLMKISIDGWGRMMRQKLDLEATQRAEHEGEITREAEKYNTKSFRSHPDGDIEFIN
jgi:hypothetical protein